MKEPLFCNDKKVGQKDVIDKLDYFIDLAEKGLEKNRTDKNEALILAKDLRKLLEVERHSNGLMNTRKKYSSHKIFNIYSRAIHRAFASTTGNISYEKLGPFLASVDSYLSGCKNEIESLEQEPN